MYEKISSGWILSTEFGQIGHLFEDIWGAIIKIRIQSEGIGDSVNITFRTSEAEEISVPDINPESKDFVIYPTVTKDTPEFSHMTTEGQAESKSVFNFGSFVFKANNVDKGGKIKIDLMYDKRRLA